MRLPCPLRALGSAPRAAPLYPWRDARPKYDRLLGLCVRRGDAAGQFVCSMHVADHELHTADHELHVASTVRAGKAVKTDGGEREATDDGFRTECREGCCRNF